MTICFISSHFTIDALVFSATYTFCALFVARRYKIRYSLCQMIINGGGFMRVSNEKKHEIGKKIKHLRKSKGMTQEDLEAKVDISRSTISNYETGRRTPHLGDLQKIASVFGVGLEYFDISAKDEAFDLIARAKAVFASTNIDNRTKEELYLEFMKLYLTVKDDEN